MNAHATPAALLRPPTRSDGSNLRRYASSTGALAVGALALGAFAVGYLAIGRLAIGRARIRRLELDTLVVRRIQLAEQPDAKS
jgi:hypothetical protein